MIVVRSLLFVALPLYHSRRRSIYCLPRRPIDAFINKIVDMERTVKIYIVFVVFSLFSLCSREYTVKKWKLLRPVQIGSTICIPITGVCIPCAFFLEADANAVVKVVVCPG